MTARPHILVVDDHKEIRDLLAKYLSGNGYDVTVANGGSEMRQALRKGGIHLVVLDIMMPGEDGLALCRSLRETSDLPVILLTAMAEEADRIVGLEFGADDYLTKPFNPRELLARIKAVLRRSGAGRRLPEELQSRRLAFAGFVLDAAQRQLLAADGKAVDIGTAEFNLLHVFLRHAGEVLDRDRLLDLSAGRSAGMFDRSIDNLVTKLRKRIEPDPKNPSLIKTVWGQGYCFTAPVEAAP
ncbi:MAG: response regulator [Alphaproteobacteria bacterium]|nr:response regulator [Alphaproteobacteria bacterium]